MVMGSGASDGCFLVPVWWVLVLGCVREAMVRVYGVYICLGFWCGM